MLMSRAARARLAQRPFSASASSLNGVSLSGLAPGKLRRRSMPPSAITRLSTTWTIACSAEALSVLRQTTVRSSANARVTSSNSFDIATVSPLTVAPNINCGHATVQRAREKRGSQQANPISALGAARRQHSASRGNPLYSQRLSDACTKKIFKHCEQPWRRTRAPCASVAQVRLAQR